MAQECTLTHFENDIGKSIEFLVKSCDNTVSPHVESVVDISGATTQEIVFKRPGDAIDLEVDGELLTDGTDGISRYQTVDGDLTPVGDWEGQLRITLANGQFYTTIIEFEIESHL